MPCLTCAMLSTVTVLKVLSPPRCVICSVMLVPVQMRHGKLMTQLAAQEMQAALAEARVGVIVLDRYFLDKEWPMKELRAFMERDRTLPVSHPCCHAS